MAGPGRGSPKTGYNSHDTSTTPDDLPNCIAPSAIIPPATTTAAAAASHSSKYTLLTTHVPQHPSPKLMSVGRNYGPGDGIFEYRDSLYDEVAAGANNTEDTNILSKQLRLLVLYIFFGVVILVLVIALAAVIVSYHRISKYKGQRADSSEKTALWQQPEDTPMETFLNRNLATSSGSRETVYTQPADYQVGQIVATVHHEATSEQAATNPQCSSGKDTAIFITGKNGRNVKDKTKRLLQSSSVLGADKVDTDKRDQRSSRTEKSDSIKKRGAGNSKSNICDFSEVSGVDGYETESCDSIETTGTGYPSTPKHCYNSIYDMLDVGVSKSSFENVGMEFNSHELKVPSEKSNEDKLYEVANNDSSVVGHLPQCSSNDFKHVDNNGDSAFISRIGLSTKVSDTSPGESVHKLYISTTDNGPGVELCQNTGNYNTRAEAASGDRKLNPSP